MEEEVFAVWKGVWYDTTGSALGGGIGKGVEREVRARLGRDGRAGLGRERLRRLAGGFRRGLLRRGRQRREERQGESEREGERPHHPVLAAME